MFRGSINLVSDKVHLGFQFSLLFFHLAMYLFPGYHSEICMNDPNHDFWPSVQSSGDFIGYFYYNLSFLIDFSGGPNLYRKYRRNALVV